MELMIMMTMVVMLVMEEEEETQSQFKLAQAADYVSVEVGLFLWWVTGGRKRKDRDLKSNNIRIFGAHLLLDGGLRSS